jgi:hypothetical protein
VPDQSKSRVQQQAVWNKANAAAALVVAVAVLSGSQKASKKVKQTMWWVLDPGSCNYMPILTPAQSAAAVNAGVCPAHQHDLLPLSKALHMRAGGRSTACLLDAAGTA